MSSECPQWLDQAFLAQVYKSVDPTATAFSVTKCGDVVGLGDNYMSRMYRVTVQVTTADGSSREDSLIVKSLEKTEPSMKEFVFPAEAKMYEDILKKAEGYWTEAGQSLQFGPR